MLRNFTKTPPHKRKSESPGVITSMIEYLPYELYQLEIEHAKGAKLREVLCWSLEVKNAPKLIKDNMFVY